MKNSRRLQTQASLDIMADQVGILRFKSWVMTFLLTLVTFNYNKACNNIVLDRRSNSSSS